MKIILVQELVHLYQRFEAVQKKRSRVLSGLKTNLIIDSCWFFKQYLKQRVTIQPFWVKIINDSTKREAKILWSPFKWTFTETSVMITFKDITAGIHFNVHIVCQEEGII